MPVQSHLSCLKQLFLLNRNGHYIAFSMPAQSHLSCLKQVFLLNRNGHYTAFSMPVPSHLTSLEQVFLLNRNGHYIASSMPVQSHLTSLEQVFLLNRNGYHIAFSMPVPSLESVFLLNRTIVYRNWCAMRTAWWTWYMYGATPPDGVTSLVQLQVMQQPHPRPQARQDKTTRGRGGATCPNRTRKYQTLNL